MLKEQILSKLDTQKSWGALCNQIQDIAEQYIPAKSYNQYIRRANKDATACEGSDYLLMNGRYWDWRQFNKCTTDIVSTFLDYFDEKSLQLILQHL